MKKIIFSVILTAGTGILHSQITKTVAKPVNMLKTKADSVCYVIGEVAAFALIEKGMGDVKITNNTEIGRAHV